MLIIVETHDHNLWKESIGVAVSSTASMLEP